MSATGGKDLLLKYNNTGSTYTTVSGLQAKTFTLNNEPIDVTNHGSNQYRELLDGAGIRSMSISGSGIWTGDSTTLTAMVTAARDGTLKNFQIVDDNNTITYQGSFKITSFELTGEYNGAATYSFSFESSGALTIS